MGERVVMIGACYFGLCGTGEGEGLRGIVGVTKVVCGRYVTLRGECCHLFGGSLGVCGLRGRLAGLGGVNGFDCFGRMNSRTVRSVAREVSHTYGLFFEGLGRGVHATPPSFGGVQGCGSFALGRTN